ncbi:MAG TPA: phage holin family protein [Terriglobales bacterium]|jgi:uncharacterized membrane protein YqjE
MNTTTNNGHVKTVAEVIGDLKTELQEFISTRIGMFRAEMQENVRTLKLAAPALMVGLVLLWTGWLLLTGFLVAMIAVAFQPSPWAFALSLLIVGLGYLILGALAAMGAWKRIKEMGFKPRRTIQVLQQDKIWIQAEKAQL